MNVDFLRNVSEAYIMDSGLEVSEDQIFAELYDIAKFLQSHDPDLYNELYEATRLQQQRVLKNYLDILHESELITEDISLTITPGAILVAIVGFLFGKSMAKTVFKTLSIIGESFETLGRWLARQGKYQQIRYAIIQENTRKCYTRCGIHKPSDISALSYWAIKGSATGSQKSREQGRCLRECYIDELIELIALHMESYFSCLRRTGGFTAVQKTDTDDIMKMISSTNIGAACESYYSAARDALDNFYRTLELVYDSRSEADRRLKRINELRSKIYEARQVVQRANDQQLQRYVTQPGSQQNIKHI